VLEVQEEVLEVHEEVLEARNESREARTARELPEKAPEAKFTGENGGKMDLRGRFPAT
jgi:hypothetical protein